MKETNIEEEYMELSVAGLYLSGQPLNHQLTSLGGRLKNNFYFRSI